MNAFDEDRELLRKSEDRKKQQSKDERKVAKVEQLIEVKEAIQSKKDDVEGIVHNKTSYYEGILERAESSYVEECRAAQTACQIKVDRLQTEIRLVEERLENKLTSLRKERDQKVTYAQQQLDKQNDALTKRQNSFDKRIERKVQKIQKVTNTIISQEGKQDVAELITPPDTLATQRRNAQLFLQKGGSIHDLPYKFPLYYAEFKEADDRERMRLANSPEGLLRKRNAEAELEEAKRVKQEREEALGALNKKVRDAEAAMSSAKVRKGCTQDEKDILRQALETAIIDRDTYKLTWLPTF